MKNVLHKFHKKILDYGTPLVNLISYGAASMDPLFLINPFDYQIGHFCMEHKLL
jgi:hypothetical protein